MTTAFKKGELFIDLTKRGTLFTIPRKSLTYRCLFWETTVEKDTKRTGKHKVFGTRKYEGEIWVDYEYPAYTGESY